jgi:hypothetical protein
LSVEFAVTLALAVLFLTRSFLIQQHLIALVFAVASGIFFLMATYRLLSRIYYREKIIVTKDHFVWVVKTLLTQKKTAYSWRHIGTLHYVGKDFRNTALFACNERYDYLNFNDQQLFVSELHQSGNLFFHYKGKGVRFARGIYSWHAEEIVRMIQLYTGSSLKLGAEWEYLMETSEWEE